MSARLARAGWLLVAFAFGLAVCIQQWRDPDVWWHLAVGRIILAHGIPGTEPFSFLHAPNPWIGQQWGYEVMLAKLVDWGGTGLVSAVMGVLGAGAYVVAALAVRAERPVPAGLLAASATLSVLVAAQVLGVKGQVITVLGTAVVLLLLSRWRAGAARAPWLLVPLMVVWANLHAGFISGLALAAFVWLATAVARRLGADAGGDLRALGAATVLGALATAINPAGVHLWPYIAQTFANPTLTQGITEWQSPDFHNTWLRLFEVQAILLVACWFWSRRTDPVDVAVAVAFFAATLQAQRNVTLFAVVAVPQLAEYGTLSLRRLGRPRLRGLLAGLDAVALPAGLVAVAAALAVRVPATAGAQAAAAQASYEPEAALGYVAAHLAGERLYSTYEWGGYVAYRFPSQRVTFVYGESAVLGSALLQDYLDIHLVRADWERQLSERGMHVAVIPAASQEWSALSEVGWTTRCYDAVSGAAVLVEGTIPAGASVDGWAPPPAGAAPAC